MKAVLILNLLMYSPPWTLEGKPQSTDAVLSPPPLPSYGVRPPAFKIRLKQVKVFHHGETYSLSQSWNIISYFQGQLGTCVENQVHRLKLFSKQRAKPSQQY